MRSVPHPWIGKRHQEQKGPTGAQMTARGEHMLMDNVVVAIAIGVFALVLVVVVKLATIAVYIALKNWTSLIHDQHNRPN
jgi:hypothetical protein